ncbi:MAG: LysM peptidoglycan-binding domain-containing protein [Solibacillus sp.]
MTKEDYKEKVEELRQEIELEDDLLKRSRASRHGKTKNKKQKNPIMTLLVFVFILIPLGILFYVWFLFEPEVPAEVTTEADDKGIVVEIQNQEPKNQDAAIVADDNKEAPANDEATKQAAAAAEAKKVEEAEIKKAEEAQKVAAAKLEEQKRLAAEQARAAEEKRKAQQTQATTSSSSNSHTVQSTDNLYRIALKYYGNGSAEYVNKIKQANGLSSDSISAGQVLLIP